MEGDRVENKGKKEKERGTIVKREENGGLVTVIWDRSGIIANQSVLSLNLGNSLIEELIEKYGETDSSAFQNIVVFGEQITLYDLKHVSLAGSPTSCLGDKEEFSLYSQQLREIDLSNTLISNFDDIFNLLEASPALRSLNLSQNAFKPIASNPNSPWILKLPPRYSGSGITPENVCDDAAPDNPVHAGFPSLEILVLNDTKISWESVNYLLPHLPKLRELYLSSNRFQTVEFSRSNEIPISVLQLNDNLFERWPEIWKLSVLPNLECLFLGDNPLSSLEYPEPGAKVGTTPENMAENLPFGALKRLFLNKTSLSAWEHLEALNRFPSLSEVKLTDLAWFKELKEACDQERRHLLIAMLPQITVLNGGMITNDERTTAERTFLRHFKNLPNKPGIFEAHQAKHGIPADLVEISLAPKTQVKLTFICQDPPLHVTRSIAMTKTVGELKSYLAVNEFGGRFRSSHLQLTHVDVELEQLGAFGMGHKDWLMNAYELFALNVHDNDHVLISIIKK